MILKKQWHSARVPIPRPVVVALALSLMIALVTLVPFRGHAMSDASPKEAIETLPNPAPTPEDITIEPSQMARGTSHTILINIRDCPNKKFGDANAVIAESDLGL